MDLFAVLEGRHSVRAYTDRPIPAEMLQWILEAINRRRSGEQMFLRVRTGCLILLMATGAGCAQITSTRLVASPTAAPQNVTPVQPGTTGPGLGANGASTPAGRLSDTVHLGAAWADFSLRFDPRQWRATAFSSDLAGLEMLVNRSIPGCQITPNVPVGFELQKDWTMEDGQSTLGGTTFTTRRFFHQGELRFVAYYGFLGNLHDGSAEVHFEGDSMACLDAAEGLFASADVIRPAPIP